MRIQIFCIYVLMTVIDRFIIVVPTDNISEEIDNCNKH